MRNNFLYSILLLFLTLLACEHKQSATEISTDELHTLMGEFTDVIVHDIFSPPVASRVYAYPSIAAYEVMAQSDPDFQSLSGQLHGFDSILQLDLECNEKLAATQAMYLCAKDLIFSEDKLEAWLENWKTDLKSRGMNDLEWNLAFEQAKRVHKHVMSWASQDNYKETRTMSKHPLSSEPQHWEPTPPGYMAAIEPHWNKIRTFVIDSATQYKPEAPWEFSIEENTKFYQEAIEVLEEGDGSVEAKKAIAAFWDCNPYVMNVTGHVMFATKKITPGGHWMSIAELASRKANADFTESTYAYALTAISLADAFISCWDEKYRSNLIRPETYINKYIDADWKPALQTPPFPEYTSGHSVISTAAAIALTEVFGDNFTFADSTEIKYGLPVRTFDSFKEASAEAAISRLYAGIHYRKAIEEGVKQGQKVGKDVVNTLNFRTNNLAKKNQ